MSWRANSLHIKQFLATDGCFSRGRVYRGRRMDVCYFLAADGRTCLSRPTDGRVVIKNLARKQHSVALAQLAFRIARVVRYGMQAGGDPFAKVKGLIQDMVPKLHEKVRYGMHTGEDPFAKVKGLIQVVLAKLHAEAGSDATEKAYCDEELAKTAARTQTSAFARQRSSV